MAVVTRRTAHVSVQRDIMVLLASHAAPDVLTEYAKCQENVHATRDIMEAVVTKHVPRVALTQGVICL